MVYLCNTRYRNLSTCDVEVGCATADVDDSTLGCFAGQFLAVCNESASAFHNHGSDFDGDAFQRFAVIDGKDMCTIKLL